MGLVSFTTDVGPLSDCWEPAAGAITAAGFRAALGTLHQLLAETPPGPSGAQEELLLATQAGMVQMMLAALYARVGSSQSAAVARVCAALLLSSADFRADLVQVLRHRPGIALAWVGAAQTALRIDDLRPSAQGLEFSSDAQVAEALLARLAAGCGAGAQVGAVRGAAGWTRSGTCTLLIRRLRVHAPTSHLISHYARAPWCMADAVACCAAASMRRGRARWKTESGGGWCACCTVCAAGRR